MSTFSVEDSFEEERNKNYSLELDNEELKIQLRNAETEVENLKKALDQSWEVNQSLTEASEKNYDAAAKWKEVCLLQQETANNFEAQVIELKEQLDRDAKLVLQVHEQMRDLITKLKEAQDEADRRTRELNLSVAVQIKLKAEADKWKNAFEDANE
jgi:DNA repair exonuclease SbcCD ATPase subunit